jgi:hypothetical protein
MFRSYDHHQVENILGDGGFYIRLRNVTIVGYFTTYTTDTATCFGRTTIIK